jgi:hypothetical protein
VNTEIALRTVILFDSELLRWWQKKRFGLKIKIPVFFIGCLLIPYLENVRAPTHTHTHTHTHMRTHALAYIYICIVTIWVTINMVSFDDFMYWILGCSAWRTLHFTITHTRVSAIMSSLPLLGSGFQWCTFPALLVSKLSLALAANL